jgi:hypothetical protein
MHTTSAVRLGSSRIAFSLRPSKEALLRRAPMLASISRKPLSLT